MKTEKKRGLIICLVYVFLLTIIPIVSHAQIPQVVSYQGYLTDTGTGAPVDTAGGTIDLQFAIYNDEFGGTALWTDMQPVAVNQGVFNVTFSGLGGLLFSTQYYLQVAIDENENTTIEASEILTPRQPFTAVPYAMNADRLDGQDVSDLGDITAVSAGPGLTGGGAAGDVMINADTTYLQRRVSSSCAAGSSIRSISDTGAVSCETDDDTNTTYTAGTGLSLGGTTFNVQVPLSLSGSAAFPNAIIKGSNSGTGYGLYGVNTASNNYGGIGSSLYGVYGYGSGVYSGVYGAGASGHFGNLGHALYGVYGQSANGNNGGLGSNSYGVYGTSGSGTAAYFSSTSGYGLIVENGSVGIGITSPSERLEVAGNVKITSPEPRLILNDTTFDGSRPLIRFLNNHGNFDSDDAREQSYGFYSTFSSIRTNDANIRVFGKASGSWGKYIEVTHTGNDGWINTDTGRLMLNAPSGVYVVGSLSASEWGTGSTSVCRDLNQLSSCSSDIRLKKDIIDLNETMDVIGSLDKLRGVKFRWNRKDVSSDRTDIGLIAQEVEQVLPEIVNTEADGYKSLDYHKMAAYLIEVNKAQQDQIEKLTKMVESMNSRLAAIETFSGTVALKE